MNIVSAIVVFAVMWFLALLILLPIGIRSQEEAGDEIPDGAMPGAPSNPQIGKKMIGATIISACVTALLWWLIASGTLSLGVMEGVFGV